MFRQCLFLLSAAGRCNRDPKFPAAKPTEHAEGHDGSWCGGAGTPRPGLVGQRQPQSALSTEINQTTADDGHLSNLEISRLLDFHLLFFDLRLRIWVISGPVGLCGVVLP